MPLTHFHDIDFPMPMREGLRCRLRCLTEIATTRNHSEQRHCAWFDPLWEIDLEPVITDQEDFDALVAFWRARKGASFRFRHPLDQEAVHVHIGTGTGTATQFQLLQTYSSGITGDTYTARRIVHLPVAATVTVTLDNVLTTDYTLNATTGVVTFSTAPGVGVLVRWSGLYDLPMRFAAQEMPTELVQVGRFANALTLVEDRASAAVAPGVAEATIPLTVLARLPLEMAEGSLFGPVHRLLVLSGEDEVTERLDVQAGTRLSASIGYRYRPWAEIQRLLAFFWGRRGRYASFQVRDPSDATALAQNLAGIGTGARTTFPLQKTYTSGGATEYRRIYRPIEGVSVYLDGVLQTSGYTLDSTRGEITFTVPPASNVEVSTTCEVFDTLVRFDMDTLELTLDAPDIASISGLELLAVNDEPVPITYQAGQTGRQVAAALGCGVPVSAPLAPPPLGLEFGHSSGPGQSGMGFGLGNMGFTGTFYGLLNGTNLLTVGMVLSHAGSGILFDLGGPEPFSDAPAPLAWANTPFFVPFCRAGLAQRGDGVAVQGVPVALPIPTTYMMPYMRGGSGGSLPVIHNDPCNPNSRFLTSETGLSSDCLGILTGRDDNLLGPVSGGIVPDVTVLVMSFSLLTASLYVSGSVYGQMQLLANPATTPWFEFYAVNDDANGCWTVRRGPTPVWYIQKNSSMIYLREPLLGCARSDSYVNYTGGGRFTLYELLMTRHLLAGPPMLPSLPTPVDPAFEAGIFEIHETMLRYFAYRYQLGLTPSYAEEGILGHWTLDPTTLQSSSLNEPVGVWNSHTRGLHLVDQTQALTIFPPLLRAMPKPTIPLSKTLRTFYGTAILEATVLV